MMLPNSTLHGALYLQIDERENEGEPQGLKRKHTHNISALVSFVCIIHVIPTNYLDLAPRQMSVYGGKWMDPTSLHTSLQPKDMSSTISNSKDGLKFQFF